MMQLTSKDVDPSMVSLHEMLPCDDGPRLFSNVVSLDCECKKNMYHINMPNSNRHLQKSGRKAVSIVTSIEV